VSVPRTRGIEAVRAGIGEGYEFFDGRLQSRRVQKQPLGTRDEARKAFSPRLKPKPSDAYARSITDRSLVQVGEAGKSLTSRGVIRQGVIADA
jgi:hypothetical protein